MDGNMSPFMKW